MKKSSVAKGISAGMLIVVVFLSGLLVSPASAASSWARYRPSSYTPYNESIGNSYSDGKASVGMGVNVYEYVEGSSYDYVHLRVSASANTRVGITYDCWEQDWQYSWQTVSDPTGIAADNGGAWVELGFSFLYYGVEYQRVWVCSNGFLCLDSEDTNPTPGGLPNINEPNPVIAVLWRNLHPERGGSITYGRDVYFGGRYFFVVSWNNVPDDSGALQSFQVLIQHRQGWSGDDFHNVIYFQYRSITTGYSTTVGVEDQVGAKGTAYSYYNLHNGACLEFSYPIAGYRLVQLKIKMTKNDGYATIDIQETNTGGYNIILQDYTNPYGDFFKSAITTAAGLLITGKAGIVFKIILITAQAAGILANEVSPLPRDADHIHDAGTSGNEAWVRADCFIEERSILYPDAFDSTLACHVLWWFTDPNSRDHSMTLTTEAMYEDISSGYAWTISTSTSMSMVIQPPSPPPGGGGDCPYVSTWDGSKYVLDNYLLPTSTLGSGSDVEDYYALEQALVPNEGKYRLLISEFQSDHSYLDQFRLLAVDHGSDVKIAVTPNGEILTYKNPSPPNSCVDSNGINWLNQISHIDGDLSNPDTFFQGTKDDYLELNFGQMNSKNAKLIVRNDQLCMVKCIIVQVWNNFGQWQEVAVIASREYWATEGVNLSPYVVEGQDLKVRLVWTQPHKLDFVGLDTSEQDNYEIHVANLVSAWHSTLGNVKSVLAEDDSVFVELFPGRQIELAFTLPNESKEARTYILYTKGHYDPMTY